MISLRLPWPSQALSPNSRGHWAIKARAAAKARCDAYLLARAAGARPSGADSAAVTMTFRAPDRRRRDNDNAIAAFKASRDGIADAIGVDDALWTSTYRMGAPLGDGRGAVEVEIVL